MDRPRNIFHIGIKHALPLICACMIIAGSGPLNAVYGQNLNLVKPEWLMPKHYPQGFHGWGLIGYLDSKEIVINDINFILSPFIEFNSTKALNDSIYKFKVGKNVGFLLDAKGEVTSLWLIE